MSGEAFNRLVRIAAGREPEPALELERPIGDIVGAGRSRPVPGFMPRARPTDNAEVNRRVRAGFRVVRDVQLRDGLVIDLDDPWR